MKPVSKNQDERNKRSIQGIFVFRNQLFKEPWSGSESHRLVEGGTPEERAAYLERQRRRFAIFCAAFGAIVLAFVLVPAKPVVRPQISPPSLSAAGAVVGLQLHETALSTSTTVETTSGTFQVRGAVSAARGDTASLKREYDQFGPARSSLCVESKAKSDCYNLL